MKHVILFLAANPAGTDQLALDREARAIQLELERARCRDHFEFVSRWATEPLDLLRELRRLKPTVVHFSGHGEPVAGGDRQDLSLRRDVGTIADGNQRHGLYFQGPDGRPVLVSPDALGRTFRAAGASVRLVVLNACYTASQAEALVGHVDCVLGMTGSIEDAAARSFAIGFYGGLGERESIATAYQQGCAAIGLDGLHDAERPQLRVRPGADASGLVLAKAPRARAGKAVGAVAALALATTALTLAPRTPAWLSREFLSAPHGSEAQPALGAMPPDMVAFPAATFTMGSTPEEIEAAYEECEALGHGCDRKLFEREGPVRLVSLSPFAIDRTEVTNKAFARWLSDVGVEVDGNYWFVNGEMVIDFSVSELRQTRRGFEPRLGTANHPVTGVSPAGAEAYCEALRKRLPTEAEWEYAARGAGRRRYPWGDTPDPAQLGCAIRIANVRGEGCPDPRSLVDVGSTPADVTPEGVQDLGGNATEWVVDRFRDRYPDCGACRNPRVGEGEYQVIRGSSHMLDASVVRATARSRSPVHDAERHTGFRCSSWR